MALNAFSTVVPFPSHASPAEGVPYCTLRSDADCPPGVVRFPSPPAPDPLLTKSVELVLLTALFGSDNALLLDVESTLFKMKRAGSEDPYIDEAYKYVHRLAFGDAQ